MASSQLIQQLNHLFNPSSIAIVGASNTFGKWGFGVFSQLWSKSEGRRIYPINKKEAEVFGVRSYSSIDELPEPVDLAVMAVPTGEIVQVIRACADRGVHTVVVISAGFAETGDAGAEIEKAVVAIAASSGMRVLGPNCMGHLNVAGGLSTLLATPPVAKGNIGLIAQSGNLGAQVLEFGLDMGVGFSKFISTGNEADLRTEDFLEYLAEDEETEVITAYIEGLREPRRFLQIAKEVTKRKPIVVVKAGKYDVGTRAVRSHTGALAGNDEIYRAALRQVGVIIVEEVAELVDVAAALAYQPLPRGKRVGILTAGGGFGVVACDTCQKLGLEVAQLSPATIEKLSNVLPPYWSGGNPVDMAGTIAPAYSCLQAMLEDENTDAILSLTTIGASVPIIDMAPAVLPSMRAHVVKTVESREEEEMEKVLHILEQVGKHCKPVIISMVLSDVRRNSRIYKFLQQKGLHVYQSPERAARTLAHLWNYSAYLNQNM